MAITGGLKTFDQKWAFRVAIEGILSFNFMKCSELSMEIAKIEQWEGGAIRADKSAGRVTFPDITLERGVSVDPALYGWANLTANGAANIGAIDLLYKRNVTIMQLDRNGAVKKTYALFNAFPTKFVAGSWDNTADENVIESMTLAFEFFQRIA